MSVIFVRQDLKKINERVKATEERISAVEDQLPSMNKELKKAKQQIAFLLNKVDDLENRSRRNNIWLVGVPEKNGRQESGGFLLILAAGHYRQRFALFILHHRVGAQRADATSTPRSVAAPDPIEIAAFL